MQTLELPFDYEDQAHRARQGASSITVRRWDERALQRLCPTLQTRRNPGRPPGSHQVHDLRHSYAAMLTAEGAHPRAIMERLGYSTIQVMLGTYGHLFPSLEASPTEALDDVYRTAEPTQPAECRKIEG